MNAAGGYAINKKGDITMKSKKLIMMLSVVLAMAMLLMMLGGCKKNDVQPKPDEPDQSSEPAEPDGQTEPEGQTEPDDATEPDTPAGRQDGERFEEIIMIEGMEEIVKYEHVINKAGGFEMDYDYESFKRVTTEDGERFISIYEDEAKPEIYLDVKYSEKSADDAAAACEEELSKDYSVIKDTRTLNNGVECVHLDASANKDGKTMPDVLYTVYVISSGEGSITATARYTIESAEGFGRRFADMMNRISAVGATNT